MGYTRNYRVDPFNATTQYKTITETHVIPGSAPFQITLGEVPVRESPSTLSVKYYGGSEFSEVASLPSKGEFFPDYLSNFNSSDSTYNTGTILFNSGDANQVITVTYKATGSIIQSNANRPPEWMYSRGSGALGNVVISSNTTLSGVYNYESLVINKGVTVTVDNYVVIKCCEAFINRGTIRAVNNINLPKNASGGMGKNNYRYTAESLSGNGYVYTMSKNNSKGKGLSIIGWRKSSTGDYTYEPYTSYYDADTYSNYGSIEDYLDFSGGIPKLMGLPGLQGGVEMATTDSEGYTYHKSGIYGGAGGKGGGSIAVFAKEILNEGTMNSSGENGSDAPGTWYLSRFYNAAGGGGGGDGGSIILAAWSISNKGTLNIKGGTGGNFSKYDDNSAIPTTNCVGADGYSGILLTYNNPYAF